MSNVYGALDSTVLDVTVDPYAIATSAVTQLSFSSLESPQNQTRDITKVLKKKLPVAAGNDELVFPFESALFTAPLSYVAETALPISLGQTVTKAVGVQWSFSSAKPISAGCITVLGDTKLLQNEATTDSKASTYTINQIVPDAVVAETTYLVNVFRYIPGQTQQQNFTWSSLDTPSMVVAKWKATMSPAVAYAGFTQSFGHAAFSFDSTTGKYVASFLPSAEWGIFNNGFYYKVDRYSSSNASKINLGLNTSTTLNVFWNLNMPARPFANVASCAYVRSEVVIDARDIEVICNPEGASSIAFYHQIYKPVIRICGGAFVSNAYSGIICPISRVTVISNESRALTLNDFTNKRLPTTIGHDSFFSGDIIGRATNGDPYNVIDHLVTLNTELISSKEAVNILSCTANVDSWLINTDNLYNAIQVVATPAYNPTSITALNKASPVFLRATTITSSDDWQVATGWRVSAISIYQNNTSFNPNLAFDRNTITYWTSAEQAYTSAGQGSQYVQIEYPKTVKLTSYKIDPNTRYTGAGAPLQWNISASNNNSTFVAIETFQFNAWQSNQVKEFFMSVAHIPYKYWRITITLIKTAGVAIHTTIFDITFVSGWSVGMTSLLSAQPLTLNTFKLILGNSYGVVVSMIDTPIDWQFNLLLIENGRIVNCGLYNLSLTTGVTKLS
ncbi:hypothetical protein T492DRAFT_842391 [Pavlovales sp. CCMP2436]|nr:hypothetical protein T492DRAFT_842391 [Pavlovales sp. CCMP2436]